MTSEAKNYLKSIEKTLVGTKQQKNEFLKNISSAVEEYCESNPDASFDDICSRFGAPDVIAKELICDTDVNEIKKKVGVKKIIAAAVAVIIAVVAVLAIVEFVDSHDEVHGNSVQEIGGQAMSQSINSMEE